MHTLGLMLGLTDSIGGVVGTASASSNVSTTTGTVGTPPVHQSNLQAYYQSDLGITTATGVSQWNDQSGNSNTLTQATGANQPTYSNTINGHTVLGFTGSGSSGQYMQLASEKTIFSGTGGGTIITVMNSTSSASGSTYPGDAPNTIIGDSTGGVLSGFGIGSGNTVSKSFTGAPWASLSGSATINDGNAHLIGNTTLSGSTWQNWNFGATDGASSTAGGSSLWNSLGAGFGTGSTPGDRFNGNIAMIAIFTRAINSSEWIEWKGWAQVYYNVTS